MNRRGFLKRLGILAGASLIPNWLIPAAPEKIDRWEVCYGCIVDENNCIDITINGKLYEKIPSGSLNLGRGLLYNSIAEDKNHIHNKDIDFPAFYKRQDDSRKRSEEFMRHLKNTYNI